MADGTAQPSFQSRLARIDMLRGIAVLLVLVNHLPFSTSLVPSALPPTTNVSVFPDWLIRLVDVGHTGVNLFLVISGFCIHMRWARRFDAQSPPDFVAFWKRRLRRLYPPYFAAILLSMAGLFVLNGVLLHHGGLAGSFGYSSARQLGLDVVCLVLLVQNLNGAAPRIGNSPFWTLALEEQLYLLYFPLLWIRRRFGIARALAIVVMVTTMWRAATLLYPAALPSSWMTVGPSRWLEWALGAVAVEAYLGRFTLAPFWRSRVVAAILTAIACVITMRAPAGIQLLADPLWGVAYFVWLNVACANERHVAAEGSRVVRLLANVGLWSYSLYLTHEPVLGFAKHLGFRLQLGVGGVLALRIVLPLTLAYLFHVAVERRFLNRVAPTDAPVAAPRAQTEIAVSARTRRRDLAIIAVVALATRGLLTLVVPFMTGDASLFHELARGVLHGHGLTLATSPPFTPSFERPPTYPLFIAAVWRVAGETQRAHLIAQILLDSAAALLVYQICRRRLSRVIAVVAALAYAALPFASGTADQAFSESLAGALVLVATWAHFRALDDAKHRYALVAVAGFAWAAAAMARPYLAPLIAVAALVLLWELGVARARRPLTAAAVMCLAATLTVAPWAARNLYWSRVLDRPFYVFQPLGSGAPYTDIYKPGFLAWLRSHEEPFVWSSWDRAPERPYLDDDERRRVEELFAEVRQRRQVTPDMDRRFQQVADDRYRKAPFRCVVWKRISRASRFWLSPHLSSIGQTVTGTPGGTIPSPFIIPLFFALSWLVSILAVLGMALRPTRALVYPAAMLAALTLILMEVGLVESRYVMPAYGLVCMAAARGAWLVIDFVRRRRARSSAESADHAVELGVGHSRR